MDSIADLAVVAKNEFPHLLGIELRFSSLYHGCYILPELLVSLVPIASKIKINEQKVLSS
jgi:hypothetical protein